MTTGTDELLTPEQAREMNERALAEAVADAIQRTRDLDPVEAAAVVIAAYRDAPHVMPSHCPDVHPEFGQCVEFYGHEGTHWTSEYADERRPDGSHPWDY